MKLLEIKNLCTIAEDDNNQNILKGLNLDINEGEVHVIMGPNGSGKSTLANTIFASPKYIVTDGSIKFKGEEITKCKTDEIAKKGLFMSFQTPEEVPGISLAQFLKTARYSLTGEKPNLYKFTKEIEGYMNELDMKYETVNREFNVSFSGGEKKKNEILQMLLANPSLAILDETDSGLDVDAIRTVSKGIDMYKNENNAVLIITHNTKILSNLKVDKVHVLVNGKIVKSGDASLARDVEERGYSEYIK